MLEKTEGQNGQGRDFAESGATADLRDMIRRDFRNHPRNSVLVDRIGKERIEKGEQKTEGRD